MIRRKAGGCRARAYAELLVDRVQVPVYGAGAYEELLCYVGIAQALCHELQHLCLSGAQARRVGR